MGAVTAIMYGDTDPSIAGMVLDSPFSSLKKLVEELVKEKISLPNFVINTALKMVKATVQKKANFLLENIEPLKFAERCFIPALFVAAKNDVFVRPHHSKLLYDIYPGDKNFVSIEGDHNSDRPRFFQDSAAIFFYNTLQVQFIKEISDNYAGLSYKNKKEVLVFRDLKNEKEYENTNNSNINMNNSNNINRGSTEKIVKNSGEHNINPEEKRGGAIPRISSEINLNNVDFDDFNDQEAANEEDILNFLLSQSREDFEEFEEKNKHSPNANNIFTDKDNRLINNSKAVDYENMKNLVYEEEDSGEYANVNRNDAKKDYSNYKDINEQAYEKVNEAKETKSVKSEEYLSNKKAD